MKSLLRQTAFPEAYIWIIGLVFLAVINPGKSDWTVCPLGNLGFEHCPGCGLGRSVSFLLKGDLSSSWEMHPLGGAALFILIARSIYLLITNTTFNNTTHYGKGN